MSVVHANTPLSVRFYKYNVPLYGNKVVILDQFTHDKVDEKAMIRNRYNRIPLPSPDTVRERSKSA